MQGCGSDEPGDERGIFHRVPCPVAAPAKFHIGPPRAEHDTRCKEQPCQNDHGARNTKPFAFGVGLARKSLSQRKTGRDGKAAVAQKKQGRMDDHAGILQQGIQAVAVSGNRILEHEGVAPVAEDEGKEGHDRIKKGPVPQPRGTADALIGACTCEKRTADAHGQRPEKHGAGLPGPERRKAIKNRQDAVCIAGNVLHLKIKPEKRVQQYGRSNKQRAADHQMGFFYKTQGVFTSLPQLQQGQTAAAQGGEQGQKKERKGKNVHVTPFTGLVDRAAGSCAMRNTAGRAPYAMCPAMPGLLVHQGADVSSGDFLSDIWTGIWS